MNFEGSPCGIVVERCSPAPGSTILLSRQLLKPERYTAIRFIGDQRAESDLRVR